MSERFNGIKHKVVKIAGDAKIKTKKLAKSTKLGFELKVEEANLDACFEKLGRAYYLNISRGCENDEKIEKLISEADEISIKIANYKKQIAAVSDKWICKHCASVVNSSKPYCPNCGQKIVANEKKAEEETVIDDEEIIEDEE